jgi:hypothetical protein
MPNTILKHPSETYPVGIDYTGKLPSSASLISTSWEALDTFDNSDASSIVLTDTSGSIDGNVAKIRVQDGEEDHYYRIDVDVALSTGDILHDHFFMHVSLDG